MAKKEDSLDGYVLSECFRIAADPNETAERRKLAEKWAERLLTHVPGQWGADGHTAAERAGIEVPAGAPGGQRLYSAGGYAGVSRNSGRVPDIDSGELSTELHSGQRTGHRARDRADW